MAQAHAGNRLTDSPRFVGVDVTAALAALDRAEGARAGADVAQDHERRGAVPPALGDVGAAGLLAHSVEIEPAHDRLDARVAVAHRQADREPFGTALQALGE